MIDHLVLDVDGVLATGQMLYNSDGKAFKIFGPHDHDGLKMIEKHVKTISFITADKRGFSISKARIIEDWGYREDRLQLVSEEERMQWFENNVGFLKTAYVADGFHDAPILARVALGIAPASARIEAQKAAKWVTPSMAGNGAVLDACLYIINTKENTNESISTR